MVAVPFPFWVNVTPDGRAPVWVMAGVGEPVAVTVKEPEVPAVKVVLVALVKTGGWPTVTVRVWVAFGLTPLPAVRLSGYVPPLPAAGVPDRVAVPLPLSVKVSPAGRVPVLLITGVG